jgi:hypothetical protein
MVEIRAFLVVYSYKKRCYSRRGVKILARPILPIGKKDKADRSRTIVSGYYFKEMLKGPVCLYTGGESVDNP